MSSVYNQKTENPLDLLVSNPLVNKIINPFVNNNVRKKRPVRAGTIIINFDKKEILITQSYGRHWGLPKGHLERNENSIECALRETLEETGIKLTIHDLKEKKSIYNGDAVYYVVNGTKLHYDTDNIDTNEISDISWMSLECIKEKVKNKEIIINSHLKTLLPYIQKIITKN